MKSTLEAGDFLGVKVSYGPVSFYSLSTTS